MTGLAPASGAFVPSVSFCSTSVQRMLAAKRANPSADTSPLEREFDERVYRLYVLTPGEIKLVKESGK